ncbi:MAG: molybdopterin-dependent oxidoreductase [Clostridiales Family XIII bacterium]|jgi:xanthine dehydrogenase molybdenum-binding subunit|nr:molybdopterin-dependent oxidoreductase [Clostridiales Family XIII bacterium]
MEALNVVGKKFARTDAAAKAAGEAVYVGDIHRRGMLHAKLLRSPLPHAMIKNIDVSRARALEGVKAVLTWKDVPQIPYTSCGHPHPADTPEDTLILSQRMRYVGDVVAAVAAVSPEIALDALDLIDVEYEALPAYFTSEEALAEGAYEIHEGSGNVCGENESRNGDFDAALAKADRVIEDEFKTPIATHNPIEPHSQLAELDGTGRLVIHVSSHIPSILRERVAKALGIGIGRVRIIRENVGGGFGGKQDVLYEPINGLLALRTGKPVMLELTREECLATTRTRHSTHIKLRTAIANDGSILGREMKIISNTGAYSAHGHNVVLALEQKFRFMYPTPNFRFIGVTAYTNIPVAGAFRGYGGPQVFFAMENHTDHIAKILGKDPLDYRMQIAYKPGDPNYSEHTDVNSCGLREALQTGADAIGYRELAAAPKGDGKIKRGVGLSFSLCGNSCYPYANDLRGARVSMNEDGTATLFVNCAEVGQGSDTVMRQICAEALGVPNDWVTVISGDTDLCPFDAGAYASSQTYVTGHAVKKAAEACKKEILDWASDKLGIARTRLDAGNGMIIDLVKDTAVCPFGDIVFRMFYEDINNASTICHEESFMPRSGPWTFGASFAVVDVDTGTGKVRVVKLITAVDAGRIINPMTAMGQLNGGNILGIGYGLFEQMLIDPKSGKVNNDSMLDYKIPTFADMPDIEGYFVETDEPSSAYGNKSLGETPVIPVASAISCAVHNATGVLFHEIPLTPERVLMAIKAAEEGKEG